MNRSQANRARIAERAGARSSTRSANAGRTGNPATDLTARTLTTVKPSGVGIRKHKCKMTRAQRNSEGRRSEWSASPYIRDAVATDGKWSQTVRSQNV